MKHRLLAAAAAAALAVTALAIPAQATSSSPVTKAGNKSLAKVLAADGKRFDRNANDFDIVDAAVTAVLKAKPSSPVKVLAQGKVRLTAFLPTDRAFRQFTKSLTGKSFTTEKATFNALAKAAGIDTIETVLLYHVVPGATITKRAALKANGARLTSAQGGTITVKVVGKRTHQRVYLGDRDFNAPNPRIVTFDVNKGNKQVAHGINRVLRPVDL